MLRFTALFAVLLAAADPARADLAALFGERPLATAVRLSPSGDRVVYLTPARTGGGTAVVVADLTTGKVGAVSINTKSLHPIWCRFKTETRLVCVLAGVNDVAGYKLVFTRMFAIDTDGGRPKLLGAYSRVLDWLPDDPTHILLGENNTYRVDAVTGVRSYQGGVDNMAFAAMTDGHGRTMLKASSGSLAFTNHLGTYYWYARPHGANEWIKVATVDMDAHVRTNVLGTDESGNNVLALMPHDGRLALMRRAITADAEPQLVFAHPQVDVDDVLRIGKYDRPVAAVYTTDTTSYDYFDPALKRLAASLAKTLPGSPTVDILDESWDGRRKLVHASSDADPGRYFLYDQTKHTLGVIAAARPSLDGRVLAKVEAVTYPARDGTPIPAYVTWPPGMARTGLPAIVMPHGGPTARDARDFDWLAQFFAASGYVVIQPNYRGSSGYGDQWLLGNAFKSWPTAIGDVDDGARWLVARGIADPKRLAIVGWSYGGYAALQASVVEPDLYRAVVAVAPVTDLQRLKDDAQIYNNRPFVEEMVGSGPHVAAGSPDRHADAITAPVLMFSGDADANVDIGHARAMDAALKRAGKRHELVIYAGLDHQLDDAEARGDLLRRSAAFLAANLAR